MTELLEVRLKAANDLASEIQGILKGKPVDTVINALCFIIAEYLATMTEGEREPLLDAFTDNIKQNIGFFASEAA